MKPRFGLAQTCDLRILVGALTLGACLLASPLFVVGGEARENPRRDFREPGEMRPPRGFSAGKQGPDGAREHHKFVTGEALVQFKAGTRAAKTLRMSAASARVDVLDSEFAGLLRRYDVTELSPLFRSAGLSRAKGSPSVAGDSAEAARDAVRRIVKLSFRARHGDDEATLRFVSELRSHPAVEFAEVNGILRVAWRPNDPFFSSSGSWGQGFRDLWGLQNISAEAAWDVSRGSGIVVAVPDTGVDYEHEDIASKVWTNPGETGIDAAGREKKRNGVDDDQNGYIDDWRGWDFVTLFGKQPDNDPFDDHGHGTHVAGTIAAVGDNAQGIIGVAPEARIMPLKGISVEGVGSDEDLSRAILYAADHGARVINASWGGEGSSATMASAVRYAHDAKDVIFVAAAGNDGGDFQDPGKPIYPAGLREAIRVSAVDHSDQKASFSNFGTGLDVAAPGGGDEDEGSVLSLLSSQADPRLAAGRVVSERYLRLAGTSMAAPHVAGVAALIRSFHPEFSAEQVRQALRAGADDIYTLGFDDHSGYGRINAARSLAVSAPVEVRLRGPEGTFTLDASPIAVRGRVSGLHLSSWLLEYGSGAAPISWTTIASSSTPVTDDTLTNWDFSAVLDGLYTLRLVGLNDRGQTFEDRSLFVLDNVEISEPAGSPVVVLKGGPTAIRGTVRPVAFSHYTFSISGVENPRITLADGGLVPVRDGLLATWDSTGVPAGLYTITLHVHLKNGETIIEALRTIVDPSVHAGWPRQLRAVDRFFFETFHWWSLTAEDVDRDGTREMILDAGDRVEIFNNAGERLSGWPQFVGSDGFFTAGPVVGDLDEDGAPEIIAGDYQGQVHVWRSDGTSPPPWPRTVSPDLLFHLSLGDIDGDGANEIIAVNRRGTFAQISVLRIDGSSLPGWPVDAGYYFSKPMAVADLDRDGRAEIVVSEDCGRLRVFRFDGTEASGFPKTNPDGRCFRSLPVLGDLDGDEDLEIVVASAAQPPPVGDLPDLKMEAFHHDGSSVAGWPQAMQPGWPGSIAIGDVDGDDRPEVVCGTSSSLPSTGSFVEYYVWHGNGKLLPGWPVRDSSSIWYFSDPATSIADVDSDGIPDIVVRGLTDLEEPFPLRAYRSDGTRIAGFTRPTVGFHAPMELGPVVLDLDSDGMLEMAWLDNQTFLHVWDLESTALPPPPWPMFHHDARRTGSADSGRVACQASDSTVCLSGGRFRVEVVWIDHTGNRTAGHALPLTSDTGYFWFFTPENVELVVKVLDGRALNGHYWVFSGGLSNVEYTLTVTDTETGAVKTYLNPPGRLASAGDTQAFPVPGSGARVSSVSGDVPREAGLLPCSAGGTILCLNRERFRVEVTWRDFEGGSGSGRAMALTADTGYFWFFSPGNVELVLKLLDGRAVNGHFWVFSGALSNVEYAITVTDTESGAVKRYTNPFGRFESLADTEAF